MAVKRNRGRWVVEFMQAGHRVFKRLPEEASRQDALDYETKLRREIFDQATLGKRPEIGLEYAIREWLKEVNEGRKSAGATNSHALRVLDFVDGEGVGGVASIAEKIRRGEIPRNRGGSDSRVRVENPSNGTINRRLCILKAVAKYAWRKGWTEENLSARIQLLPENNARQIYLSAGQVKALIAAVPDDAKAFVAIAAFTGLRQSEIMCLTKEDIQGETIRVRDSKTGEPRSVPAVAGVLPYLEEIPLKKHRRTLYKGFEAARLAIGMPHLHYHDLRHTTASLMIQAGVHINTVGEILGHKSVQTTRRYAHLSEGNKRKALQSAFPHQNPITTYEVNEDK